MSSQAVRCLPLLACSLMLGLVLAGASRADDILKDEAQRKAIEAQKVEKDVKESLEMAAGFAKGGASESAVKLLNLVREQVAADTNLEPSHRKDLLAIIDGRIKSASLKTPDPINPLPDRPILPRTRDKDDAGDKQGYDAARKIIDSRKNSIADARDLTDKRNQGVNGTLNSVEKSMVAQVNDVEFPRDWLERTKKRSEFKMTPAEEKLMKALNTPLRDINFDKTSFSDVLKYLQDASGQSIIVSDSILKEVGVTYETGVVLKADNVTLRTVLKKVLGDLNLTYIVRDAKIEVTTPERAKQTTSTRTYYIGDLAPIADVRLGPIGQRLAMAQAIASIMTTITQIIEPNSWQVNNPEAVGTIAFEPITMSLIVKQTAEVHFIMGVSMRR